MLEHVEHDDRALSELRRVLTPDGIAFLHSPIIARTTLEYGFADPRQHDHRRAYGPDIIDRIGHAGLSATLFLASTFDRATQRRRGLIGHDAIIVVSRPPASETVFLEGAPRLADLEALPIR